MNSDPYHRSGITLPTILRRKLQPPAAEDARFDAEPGYYWTADEMEDKLQQTAVQLQLIQKQIQRGEECYTEEAATHSIYKGWDGFIDARVDGPSVNSSQLGAPRRMPMDNRWFSGSFTDVAAYIQHKPMGRFIHTESKPAAKSTSKAITVATPKPTAVQEAVPRRKKEPESEDTPPSKRKGAAATSIDSLRRSTKRRRKSGT